MFLNPVECLDTGVVVDSGVVMFVFPGYGTRGVPAGGVLVTRAFAPSAESRAPENPTSASFPDNLTRIGSRLINPIKDSETATTMLQMLTFNSMPGRHC